MSSSKNDADPAKPESRNAAALLVACLETEGVERVYGVPGEETLELLEALRTSTITFIPTRHEQHAAFMAATYGRLTGRAGVCLSTLGPGATNLLTGVAQAQLGGHPLVAITGQKPLRGNLQGAFQLIDVVAMFRPLTKWATSIAEAAAVPRSVRHAFQTAEGSRPGATHIELPQDVAQADAGALQPHPRTDGGCPQPDPWALEQAVARIRSAKRPLLLASGGANDRDVATALAGLTARTGLHVATTQAGKGSVSEADPQSLFALGIHREDYAHAALRRADLVVTIGYDVVEYPPSVWNPDRDKAIVHLAGSAAVPDSYYAPELEVVGELTATLRGLTERLAGVDLHDATFACLREAIADRLFDAPCTTCYPPQPQNIVYAVRRVMQPDDITCLDNGIYKVWFARMYQTMRPQTLLLDNALATMGAGLAMAMEAKAVHPERKVMAVVGDGGFMMNVQDLETAVRMALDLVILVLVDDAYGFIRWKQADRGLPPYGLGFGNPDFVRLAEAFGARGLEVGPEDDLDQVLRDAHATRGVALVACPIDYSPNEALSCDRSDEIEAMLAGVTA